MPLMKFEREVRRLAGDLEVGQTAEQLAEHHGDLAARELRAEAEVRPRAAEADVVVRRARRRRTGTGASKTASSRFAELYHMTTFSPARIGWPAIVVSAVAVRRKWMTGVAQRTISSTAVGATVSKSSIQRRRCCGVIGQRLHAVADRVARGLVAGRRQQDEERSELLLGQALAVDRRRGSAPT